MYQLKQMLNDLIDHTFAEDPRLRAYHAFYIEVLDKNYKGRHGDYNKQNRHIRLMNTYRDENKLIITAVHELAHHINNMQGNTDIHGKGFYDNYKKLLHGTLDMSLVTKDDWLKAHEESHDSQSENKVQRIIESYIPKDAEYKAGKRKITVYGAFDIKDDLKKSGFSYNKIVKGWEIELEESMLDDIKKYLDEKGVKYTVSEASKYIVKDADSKDDKPKWTLSVLNAYPIKDKLKERGYHYRKDDFCWCIQYTTGEEVGQLVKDIKELCQENNVEFQHLETQKYAKKREVQAILSKQSDSHR